MPWSDLPDPVPEMTPWERVQAFVSAVGVAGFFGVLIFVMIVGWTLMD